MLVDLNEWWRWRTRQRVPASAVPVPAQALYDGLVKMTLSPAFRAMGFKGSGGRYALRSDGCWALLGLQKSAYSDGKEVQFTANLLVASKSVWTTMREQQPNLPERPAPSTDYGDGVATRRIGQLLPEAADTWWRVHDGADLEAVAQDITTSVEAYGLPWMRQQLDRSGCST